MRGARLQRFEPHVEVVALGLMLLAQLVERGTQPRAIGMRLGEVALDLGKLRAGRGKRIVGLGELAGEAGDFCERLLERGLQRLLFIFEQRDALARGGEVALQGDIALFRGVELIGQGALVVGEGLALRGLLSEFALELANVRTSDC